MYSPFYLVYGKASKLCLRNKPDFKDSAALKHHESGGDFCESAEILSHPILVGNEITDAVIWVFLLTSFHISKVFFEQQSGVAKSWRDKDE